jgi:ribosomal-protein-serine acetyltransferase
VRSLPLAVLKRAVVFNRLNHKTTDLPLDSAPAATSVICCNTYAHMEDLGHYPAHGTEAEDQTTSPRLAIATAVPELRLIELTADDAPAYYDLVDRNRAHLTQHGDYLELGEATPESVAAELRDPENRHLRFGVWLNDALIGRVDLNQRTPEDVVLGYWLGDEYTGQGYGTLACQALIDYGKAALGARTVWAGVTKGNARSEALLGRLGFQAVSDQGTYTRFKRPLT